MDGVFAAEARLLQVHPANLSKRKIVQDIVDRYRYLLLLQGDEVDRAGRGLVGRSGEDDQWGVPVAHSPHHAARRGPIGASNNNRLGLEKA